MAADAGDGLSRPLIRNESGKFMSFFWTETRTVFRLAWPSVVSGIARSSMVSIEAVFVGHITDGTYSPKEFLAASTLTFMILGISFAMPMCFLDGISVLAAQALGAGEKKMAGIWFQLSMFWTAISAIPIILFCFVVGDVLALLGFPKVICELAGTFALYNIPWAVPRLVYGVCTSYFRTLGNPRPAMYNDLIFACVHPLVNWVFVFGGPFRAWFGWEGFGFVGAGISISVTRTLEALTYMIYMFGVKGAHLETWPGWNFEFLRRTYLSRFMRQTLPQGVSWVFRCALDQAVTFMIAGLGVLAVSANCAVFAITSLISGTYYRSIVSVTGQRVGFHLGAGDPSAARRAALILFGLASVSMVAIFLALVWNPQQTMTLITSDADVIALAVQVFAVALLSQLLEVINAMGCGGVLNAQGRSKLSAHLTASVGTPLTLGTVAFLVYYCHADLPVVITGSMVVSIGQVCLMAFFFHGSDWPLYARQAQERQKMHSVESTPQGPPVESTASLPAVAPALSRLSSSEVVVLMEQPPMPIRRASSSEAVP